MTARQYMRDVSVIHAVWLPELVPAYARDSDGGSGDGGGSGGGGGGSDG